MRDYACRLRLHDTNPIIRKSCPIPLAYRSAVKGEVNRLLHNGMIEHAHSPYCNPIRVIRKADRVIRLCLDARELNRYLEDDSEAPPLIEDLLQSHEGIQFFTALDVTEGYYQLTLHPESCHYTAFRIDGHVLQYCVVSLVLRSDFIVWP